MDNQEKRAPFIALSRHRLQTDGRGVTTLAGFHGCPLRCKYCINPHSFAEETKVRRLTPRELYEAVKAKDEQRAENEMKNHLEIVRKYSVKYPTT